MPNPHPLHGKGRKEGNPRPVRRTVQKNLRFTEEEWKQIKAAVQVYGGRETEFMRGAILEKAESEQDESRKC